MSDLDELKAEWFEFGRSTGLREAEERIIKLLETELSQDISESAGYIMDKENYPVHWVRLIALIKGEK